MVRFVRNQRLCCFKRKSVEREHDIRGRTSRDTVRETERHRGIFCSKSGVLCVTHQVQRGGVVEGEPESRFEESALILTTRAPHP